MAKELKAVIERSRHTLLADAVGVCSLLVILFVGVSLPAMV